MRIHIEVLCKCLDKRSAARRTGFVQHDGVNYAVSDLHALHILTADIDDEINIRAEVLRGLEVRHGLDLSEINAERGTDDIFAVTGNTAVRDICFRRHLLIELLNDIYRTLYRITLVTCVVGIDHLAFFVDQNCLSRGTSGIDTEVARTFLFRKLIQIKRRLLMTFVEQFFFMRIREKRRDTLDVRLEAFFCRKRRDQIGKLDRFALCTKCGAEGNIDLGIIRDPERLDLLFKCSLESPTKLGVKEQRTTEESDVTSDRASAGKTCDRLVNDCLENRGREVLFCRAFVNKRLQVTLGKYTASGSDRV